VIEILDVFDFHGGSSDVPAWSPDGRWVYYTALAGDRLELMRVAVEGGTPEQLTRSDAGVLHYHPRPSGNGRWIVCGTKRYGVRQICVVAAGGGEPSVLTQLPAGSAAMWPHWRPEPK
jgi:Tol biopolymer transport system component